MAAPSSAPPPVAPRPSPADLCRDYRARTPAPDPKKAGALTLTISADYDTPRHARMKGMFSLADEELRDGARADGSVTRCTIIWGSKQVLVTQTAYRQCCGPVLRHSKSTCVPGPYTEQVSREERLIELVFLRDDGTIVTRHLDRVTLIPEPVNHPCGRRPEGFTSRRPSGASPSNAGEALAAMAELESASIASFDRLARELERLGADASLVLEARRARADEVRHARVMRRLAARFGVECEGVAGSDLPCRDLYAVARENAVEGCVFETYGALVATFQAARAEPSLRRVFARIARDERRHAALAERVHAWAIDRLDADARAAIEAARHEAIRVLIGALAEEPAPDAAALGLPNAREARALVEAYFDAA